MTPSRVFRLSNTLQRYAWGSQTAIPDLLGAVPDGTPVAEMWLGAHPLAPSLASLVESAGRDEGSAAGPAPLVQPTPPVDLAALLRSSPDALLGRAVVEGYGPRLPFLLKVLAAERPLSLQVHPHPHVARAGFRRENAEGIPLDAPTRNYKDDQHKPEMILALSPFEGLCGFRRPARTLALLDGLDGELVGRMREALRAAPNATGIRAAFEIALGARDVGCHRDIEATVASVRARIDEGRSTSRGDQTLLDLARFFPGDPGALVSLMLNRVSLAPGEAVFLAAGEVHAYLSGVGVEVMASSDNVLRAGFTSKRVDVAELLSCASYAPSPPQRPVLRAEPGGLTAYRAPVPEFSLLFGDVSGHALVAHDGPRVVLCLEGSLTLTGPFGTLGTLDRGESVFVPHDVGHLALDGRGQVVVAYVP